MGESRRIARAERRNRNARRVNLSDVIQREKERHSKMDIEFNWPDLCKHIPKCVLYRANHLRQIAVKGLGQCSYKLVDRLLMFTFELLVNESSLTSEKFAMLKARAASLTFQDARTILTGDIRMIDNLLGLKFDYHSGRVSSRIVPLEDTAHGIDESFFTNEYEETEPITITEIQTNDKFDRLEYEEKLNEYYEKHSPIISRESFGNTIIDTLRRKNAESELIDFLGFEAMELMQYIIENRDCIAALNSDFTVLQKKPDLVIDELVAV
ncbi:unnamed protein product, partial [Heterotrigona itama]